MTTAYKIRPEYMAQRYEEAVAALNGKPMLATFVESTRKIVAVPNNYLRFGVYWWAVKAILRNHNVDFGGADADFDWLRDEYTLKTTSGAVDEEHTLLAAWIFAEDNTFNPQTEFEIDDVPWIIDDPDMQG